MSAAAEVLVSLLLVVGAAFAFLGSLGLARFPDFYMRLHGPSKATTLGIGCLLLASLVFFGARGDWSLHELAISVFITITTPVSAHLLARAARHRQVPQWRRPQDSPQNSPQDPLRQRLQDRLPDPLQDRP